VTKFVKQTWKHDGNVIQVAIDVGGDVVTVFAPSSTPMDRIESVVSLVSPVDSSDLKAAKGFTQSLGKANGGRKGNHDTRGQSEAIGDAVTSRSGGEYQRTGGSLLKETRINTPRGEKTHRYKDNEFNRHLNAGVSVLSSCN
jgi:hypothetical protein